MNLSDTFNYFNLLCGNKEIVIKHRYTRDGGHGDLVEENFVMLSYDGENPYFIDDNGIFNINGIGFECALLYVDTPIEDMLIELYNEIDKRIKKCR
jgi:hypothetical protein